MEQDLEGKKIAEQIATDPSSGIYAAIDVYGGRVAVICRSFLRGFPNEDVEETVADVFAELWKSIGRFDANRVDFKCFLYGIARNCAKNKLKRLKKEAKFTSEEQEVSETDVTEEQALDAINSEILTGLMRRLKSPADRIFYLKYISDLPNADIAKRLNISVKKVENCLYRTKPLLKRMFEKEGIIR